MKPLISIIIPVHNTEEYLEKCLDSVVSQSFDAIEILIINDHSTDKSEYICKQYARNNNKIRIYSSKERGVSSARNLGIKHARGEWVTFVDSDDIISKHYCSSLIKATDADIDLVIARTISFKGDESNQLDDGFKAKRLTDFSSHDEKLKLIKSIFVDNKKYIIYPHVSTCSAKLFRKKLIQNKKFNTSLKVYEDAIFNIEAIQNSKKVRLIDKKIYFYRLNTSSATKKYSNETIDNYKKVYVELNRLDNKYKIDYSKYENYFAIKNLNAILQAFYRSNRDVKFIKNIIKQEPYAKAIDLVDMKYLPRKRMIIILLIRRHQLHIAATIYRCFA